MNEAITWTETMFLPGQDSVVGNPKCYRIPASPWGQVTLCRHRFCPRPDTCSTRHISTSTGRVRQAAGGGSRQRRWPHTCRPFSSATRTPPSSPTFPRVCRHPFPLSPREHSHLRRSPSRGEGLTPFSLSPHAQLPVVDTILEKGVSAIFGVSFVLGSLWDSGILYLGIIYCYFFPLQFHFLENCYLFAYIYLYLVSPYWWKETG